MDETKQRKKLEPVISGGAEIKKNTDPTVLVGKFLSDGIKTAGKSMIGDVLFPQCKLAVYNALINGLNVLFWGPGGQKKPISTTGLGTRINYSGNGGIKSIGQNQPAKNQSTGVLDPEDVTFETRIDAQTVYDSMIDIIDQYDRVSLAEFLELAKVPNDNFTYQKYGWAMLPPADIRRLGNGRYYIRLPNLQLI